MAEPGEGAQIAAQSLFTAASAANAVPVAGTFVSAGLALAGLFAKIFGGRRRKKREEAAQKRKEQLASAASLSTAQQRAPSGPGIAPPAPIGTSAPVVPSATPSFSSFGGGQAPSVQPAQQALNNTLGLK